MVARIYIVITKWLCILPPNLFEKARITIWFPEIRRFLETLAIARCRHGSSWHLELPPLSLSLSHSLSWYVALYINQPAPAVHKLAVWVEAGLSSLHFAKLTRTKSLPHYWRTRVRRPRREPADPGNPTFFFPFRPPSPLSLYSPRVGGCERDDKAQRTCVTLSYPVPPPSSSLCRVFLLRYVCTLDPGPHIVPRDLLRTHTRRILHCSAVGNSSRDPTVLVMVAVGFSSLLSRDRRHIWKRNPKE